MVGEWVDGKLTLQSLLEAIVAVANQAAAVTQLRVPPRKGSAGLHGPHSSGIEAAQAECAAFGIHKYLQCSAGEEKDTLDQMIIQLGGHPGHPGKDQQGQIRTALQTIKKVWVLDCDAEASRQSKKWDAVERKLKDIEENLAGAAAGGSKRKRPGTLPSEDSLYRRRSGPAAGSLALDSSSGESSSGVLSSDD